jgi:dihydroxyacid dehydratase/phosphogluconate dehydratase
VRGASVTCFQLDDFDSISERVLVPANIRPSGAFLMEDFYYAGGLRALMGEIRDLLHMDARAGNGKTLWRASRRLIMM